MTQTKGISPKYFSHFFKKLPAPLFFLDERGRFLHVNAAFTELLGYSAEESRRMSFADIAVKPGHFDSIESETRKEILNFELYYINLQQYPDQ